MKKKLLIVGYKQFIIRDLSQLFRTVYYDRYWNALLSGLFKLEMKNKSNYTIIYGFYFIFRSKFFSQY